MSKERIVKDTASIKGDVQLGTGSTISYGVVADGSKNTVKIDNNAMVLENSVLRGTEDFPVVIGQQTVLGHRCEIEGANLGSFCEIGNGVKIGEGCYIGDYVILGEGTVLPPGAKVASRGVAVGNPFVVIRGLTIEDYDMIASMRSGNLEIETSELKAVPEQSPNTDPEPLIDYKDYSPEIDPSVKLGEEVEIIGKVNIGANVEIGDKVKIIGDTHGAVTIREGVKIGKSSVLHMLPGRKLIIEDHVEIGRNCIVHGCKLMSNVVVDDNAIICDDAVVGCDSVVKIGSVVPQRMEIPNGKVVEGHPVEL